MRKPCKLCGQPVVGRGLCRRHYQQAVRAHDFGKHKPKREAITVRDRLLSKIRKTEAGCWEWTGHRKKDAFDYGLIWVDGRMRRAHRVSYELHKGPITGGLDVLHQCDNPPCINPGHLFLGTRGENCTDAASKNRYPLNSRHWNTKVSTANVAFIRDSDLPQNALAQQFGVAQSTISRIRSRKRRVK